MQENDKVMFTKNIGDGNGFAFGTIRKIIGDKILIALKGGNLQTIDKDTDYIIPIDEESNKAVFDLQNAIDRIGELSNKYTYEEIEEVA